MVSRLTHGRRVEAETSDTDEGSRNEPTKSAPAEKYLGRVFPKHGKQKQELERVRPADNEQTLDQVWGCRYGQRWERRRRGGGRRGHRDRRERTDGRRCVIGNFSFVRGGGRPPNDEGAAPRGVA